MIELIIVCICFCILICIVSIIQDEIALRQEDRLDFIKKRLKSSLWKKKSNYRTIVHEAGHAFLAWYCNNYSNIRVELFAWIKKPEYAGWVLTESREFYSEYDLWGEIVFKLGGLAAEKVYLNTYANAQASDDLKWAKFYAEKLTDPSFEYLAEPYCADVDKKDFINGIGQFGIKKIPLLNLHKIFYRKVYACRRNDFFQPR